MNGRRRHNAEIIFKGLLLGLTLNYGDYRYVIENERFGILGTKLEGFDEPGDVFLGLDWSLSSFLEWCALIPEDIIFEFAANITLNEMRKLR